MVICNLIIPFQCFSQETIEKHLNAGKSGSDSGSLSSSSSQLQLDGDDSLFDVNSGNACSKAPVGYSQLQDHMKTEATQNSLENCIHKLDIVDDNKGAINDMIPPRFQNSKWEKNFKKQKSRPWVNKQKQTYNKGSKKEESNQKKSWGDESTPQQELRPSGSSIQNQASSFDPWREWEASVVVDGRIEDEYLEDIVVVDDNDNLDDVMVQQYVNALHQETNGTAVKPTTSKVTPSLIQELGNLKSTTNADSYKMPAGTIPNPPKGPDRWGGVELKGIEEPTGWGDIVQDSGNWYDDGSMMWGAPSVPYGANGGWSWNS